MKQKPKSKYITPTTFRVPPDLMREVRDAASGEERTVTAFVIRALRSAVEKSKQERGVV